MLSADDLHHLGSLLRSEMNRDRESGSCFISSGHRDTQIDIGIGNRDRETKSSGIGMTLSVFKLSHLSNLESHRDDYLVVKVSSINSQGSYQNDSFANSNMPS